MADCGHVVEFRKKSEGYKVCSADAFVDGELWEFKAPNGSKLATVEKNLRRAKSQSNCVVFDSRRIKKIPDLALSREILLKAPHISGIHKVKFINRRRECIDIYVKKR